MSTISASTEAGLGMPANPPQEDPVRRKEDLYRADFDSDIELREASDGPPVMAGHFSRFNEWTRISSNYEGTFMERVAPGAFAKTIAEGATRMRVLFNHGKDVLGQQILGPIRSIREDDQGAAYEVPLFDGIPSLILEGLRANQYGSSFRFQVVREHFDSKPKRSDYNPEGIPERTIQEAKVREFGPVTFGAYAGATAGIRSITDDVLFTSMLGDPERLRSMIAEEVRKNNRVTVSLSTTDHTHDRTEPDPPGDTTPEASEPEPSEATTQTENRASEPEPSGATTRVQTPTRGLFTTTRKETPRWRL